MTLKQETASVLAKFSDKSNERKLVLTIIDQYKLDSPVMWPDYDKTINNPVMIGTVFAKYYGDNPCPNKDLYALWCDCGIDKSLNEIFRGETVMCETCNGDNKERCNNPDHGLMDGLRFQGDEMRCPVCGWDEECLVPDGGCCFDCEGKTEGFKNPNAQALLEFIKTL